MKPPRPWLAALLNLVAGGPIGQIYAGDLRRSIAVWFVGVSLLITAAIAIVSIDFSQFVMIILFGGFLLYQIVYAIDAFFTARRNSSSPRKSYQKWWFYVAMGVVFYIANYLTALTIKSFVCEAFRVPWRSMSPTISHEDRILVDRLWASPKRIKRYDVIVFKSNDPGASLYVKRVIGLPGEKIEIRNRIVYINDEKIDDPKAIHDGPMNPMFDFENYGPITIPEEHLFVLGDNRFKSRDSRFVGPIPFSNYYGHARWILFSRDYVFNEDQDIIEATPVSIRWDRIGLRIQ